HRVRGTGGAGHGLTGTCSGRRRRIRSVQKVLGGDVNPRRRAEARAGYLLIVPSLIGVGGFLLVPVLVVLVLSVLKWNLISAPEWVGLANYADIFSSVRFANSMWVTLLFTLMSFPTAIALGLLLALWSNRKVPGTSGLRVRYVLPWVGVALALDVVWQWTLTPSYGAVNALIRELVEWFTDSHLALLAVA